MSEKLRIGILEYEEDLLELLAYSLNSSGFSTVLFGTEQKMWKHVLRRHLDLLIIGNLAPDTNPREFGKRVKEKLGDGQPLMIRLSTDAGENNFSGQRLFVGTIIVPETPRAIVKSIREIWEKHAPEVA